MGKLYSKFIVEIYSMIETDFMKLYEKLSKLDERWHHLEEYYGRLWYSDSEVHFRNFMKNLPNTGMKGVRLIVAPGFYLAANAMELQHASMEYAAEEELFLNIPTSTEWITCGIPKCTDYDLGNFEIDELRQTAEENPDDEFYAKYLNYDSEKEHAGALIADYGIFELHLYNFISRTCPEYVSKYNRTEYFEDSETYRVLKPMLKRIYIYGKE